MRYKDKIIPRELVCPHIYEKYEEASMDLIDPLLVDTLQIFKDILFKDYVIECNDSSADDQSEDSMRGMVCNLCQCILNQTNKLKVAVSAQTLGKSVVIRIFDPSRSRHLNKAEIVKLIEIGWLSAVTKLTGSIYYKFRSNDVDMYLTTLKPKDRKVSATLSMYMWNLRGGFMRVDSPLNQDKMLEIQ